ncbi:MAG: phosphate ABC transporter substrate-binding/OmpA family protein [Pseudomonadota bacterium]
MKIDKLGVANTVKKALMISAAVCVPSLVTAQEITLKSTDGGFDIVGELIEYQDNIYVVRTNIGALRVSADRVQCVGSACPDIAVLDDEVTIAGSDAIAEGLVPVLLSGYAAHLDAEQQVTETIGSVEINAQFVANQGFGDLMSSFRVRSSISSDAFANLLGKSAEIGLSSRRITIEEARTLREYGSGSMVSPNNEHIVAVDSIVMITHPSNPVKTLSMSQVADIYNGAISNWNQVGGLDAPINAVHLRAGAGTRAIFEERIFGASAAGNPVNVVSSDSSLDVSRAVSADENAIGYVSIAFQRGAQAVNLTNECGISMTPDFFSAKTGEYALQRALYFYTREDTKNDQANEFLEWSKSSAADAVIAKTGFIDLGVARVSQGNDSPRAVSLRNANLDAYETGFAEDMLATMSEFDRLSSTFRFRTGSDRLTPQARVGLERLIGFLEQKPEGTEILLVGFTDDQGPFDSNLSISIGRAEQVVTEIRAAADGRLDHINLSATGYGELSPAACNVTPDGRSINRRVEVWSKPPRT